MEKLEQTQRVSEQINKSSSEAVIRKLVTITLKKTFFNKEVVSAHLNLPQVI